MQGGLRGAAAAGERLPGPTAIDDAELREHASTRRGASQRHDRASAPERQVDRAAAGDLVGPALHREQGARGPADVDPADVAQAGIDADLDRASVEPARLDA